MIFGGKHDQYQERYTTYEDAWLGHLKCVKVELELLPDSHLNGE
jgi:hypothetical protein